MSNRASKVKTLLEAGFSYAEISQRLNITKPTVAYHARRLGVSKKLPLYDWSEVQRYYDTPHTREECIDHFGFHPSTWSAAVKSGKIVLHSRTHLYLCKGRKVGGHTLRRYLRMEGVSYLCVECELSEWRGNPLTLQVDHIDGDKTNNEIDNLRFLCPNCHSQTDTFAGRNHKHLRNS